MTAARQARVERVRSRMHELEVDSLLLSLGADLPWLTGYENAQGNLRLYMAQLRKKLEPDPARPRHLLNEPGMGYRFQP